MSFHFWNRLSQRLAQARPDSMAAASPELAALEQQRRRSFFAPAFERLVALIRGRVRFPENYELWGRNERSDFKAGRHDVGDTLVESAEVLGAPRCAPIFSSLIFCFSRDF